MTDKTPAMHELPEPDRTMWQHGKQIDHYTADQMRAYALATLQAQPAAAVSDEEIWGLWDSQERTGLVGGPCPVKFARAILALRPQAVPMTRAQRLEVFRKAEDRMAHDINLCWRNALIEETEAHHGITQRADGGEKQA